MSKSELIRSLIRSDPIGSEPQGKHSRVEMFFGIKTKECLEEKEESTVFHQINPQRQFC
jgi:hypothetical protein